MRLWQREELKEPSTGTIEKIYINLDISIYNNIALRYGAVLGIEVIENCALFYCDIIYNNNA